VAAPIPPGQPVMSTEIMAIPYARLGTVIPSIGAGDAIGCYRVCGSIPSCRAQFARDIATKADWALSNPASTGFSSFI